ncbi:3,4-dihydroxy-2-butanone-4-phosphate synthase [Nocardia sp. NPDC004860]|uniref:3,4-dihydroxy-2-butanone-4-phosphate synthase n=1 Tax=Nocardia sp. NPDC004860 TaxID=3154557 RepID=UPI0033A12301
MKRVNVMIFVSDRVETLVDELGSGRCVLLLGEYRGAAAHLVLAAAAADTATVAFLVRHGSGFLEVAMPEARCDQLCIPAMWDGVPTAGPAYGVSVDLAGSDGTGISARDRAATIRRLADPAARHGDFTRPGHVVPVRVPATDSAEYSGAAYVAMALAHLATGRAACVVTAVPSVHNPAELADADEIHAFGAAHGLSVCGISEVSGRNLRLAAEQNYLLYTNR